MTGGTVSEALESVGHMGRFQIIFFIIFVGGSIINGIITFQFQALSIIPKIECLSKRCHRLQNKESAELFICKLGKDEWKFDGSHENWLTEYNLYCEKTYLKGMGTTVYFLGFMVGVSMLSSLCDKFGRRKASVLLLIGVLFAAIGQQHSSTLSMTLAFRFILGFFYSGLSVCLFTAFCEFTSPNFGAFTGICTGAAFTFGGSVASFLAFHSPHWQGYLPMPIFFQGLMLLSFYLLVPETPFWLVAKKRNSDALKVLNYVAKINGKSSLQEDYAIQHTVSERAENPFRIIIYNHTLRDCVAKLSFAWFTVSICYYALQFNAGSLGNDEYSVMMWMGILDIPARMAIIYFAFRRGRRWSANRFFLVAAISLGLCMVPHVADLYIGMLTVKSIFTLVGHGAGGAVFSLLYTYTSELLPTLARSTGVSMCSTAARIASILSPFVIILNHISGSLIYFISLSCIVISMNLIKSLPETLNKPLPNSVEECEILFNKKLKVETII